MKIGFIVMKRVSNNAWLWEPEKVCYEDEDLKQYRNNPNFCVASEDSYYTIKGVQYNKDFRKYIDESRAYLNIPEEGLPFERFCTKYRESYNLRTDDEVVDPEYQEPLSEYWYLEKRMHIKKMYYLQMGAGGYTNLELLVLYGLVVPVQDVEITWNPYVKSSFSDTADTPYMHISINIYSQVSKNQLIEYIKKNYKEIKIFSENNLPKRIKKDLYVLDKKSIQQLQLKAEGKSHKEIFEEVQEYYNRRSDNVRIKYRRAVARVKRMFSLKTRD